MTNAELFAKFSQTAPFAVLTRCVAQHFISSELDDVFEAQRGGQYRREVAFSAIALAVADVALNFSENFNQAYRAHRATLAIAVTSFYDKIKATRTSVSEAVVSASAAKAAALQDALDYRPWQILSGYNVVAFDGNHLAKTDKRLGVLHEVTGAPLPGTVVARYDLQRELFERAYLLEDAHAQESSTCGRIVDDLQPRDVVVADRHFCIVAFLAGIAARKAQFAIRQHGRLQGVLRGKRRRIGRGGSGMVSEQALRLSADPQALVVRRVTVELDEPTRDGATAIHILTNLPAAVDAKTVAEIYRLRWEEETAFHRLQMTLTCELASVGHPRAALLLFCMAMVAYNMRQVVFAALSAEHDDQAIADLSHFHVSVEIARYTEGMSIALDEAAWAELIPTRLTGFAKFLRRTARAIDLAKYKKNPRGPRKKKPLRSRNVKSTHVSTAKRLQLARAKDP